MPAHHGSTLAAWTTVVIVLLGFTVGGVGLVLGPHWPTFWVGCALLPLALVVGKIMAAAGLGAARR